MSDLGKGIRGSVRVKADFDHQGKNYSLGDIVEGCLREHQGVIIFERIDFTQFDPANFDRIHGVNCMLTFAYDHILLYKENGIIKRKDYVKGESEEGILKEKEGEILFFLKGQWPVTINKFMDVSDLHYKGSVQYEIEDITRLFDALG
ncbi:MAG: hypothetical protein D3923_19810 [Candidatus Electrothrix sp. AR3]|nr:hypothetical protein [Candidatus Electrothrix sp. AR3]